MKKFFLLWTNFVEWIIHLSADQSLYLDEEGLPTQRNRYYS